MRKNETTPAATSAAEPARPPEAEALHLIMRRATRPGVDLARTTAGLDHLVAIVCAWTIAVLQEVPAGSLDLALASMTGPDMQPDAEFFRHCHRQAQRIKAQRELNPSNN